MADWNQLKEKAMSITKAGVSKAKELGEIAKLNIENLSEEDKIKQAYIEIGQYYVALHQDAPEAGFEEMFQKIADAKAKIQANKDKIAILKTEGDLTDEDLDEVVVLEELKAPEVPPAE